MRPVRLDRYMSPYTHGCAHTNPCGFVSASFCPNRQTMGGFATVKPSVYAEGIGDVVFTRLDGKTVSVNDVRYDQISNVGANDGVIAGEREDGTLFHVPFVAYWTVNFDRD